MCDSLCQHMELTARERFAAAAALAGATPSELPPSSHDVDSRSTSWGLSTQLKPHQAEGVSWLIRSYLRGINVILGDEMGLGKTFQAIALISFLKFERHLPGPYLVLCPLSVIDGWSTEFLQRAPKLQVLRYIGNKEERSLLSKKICNFVNSQPPTLWDDPNLPFDVLLTTHDLAMVDLGFLSRFKWRYGIVDEAQRLKNFSSVLYRNLDSSYRIPRRLLVTGTPIQNNLTELWSLLHFCMPKVFNDLEVFLQTFPISATPGSSKEHDEDVRLLKTILNVFMLRRMKSALVQKGSLILPSLSEVTIMAKLVPLQKDVYISVLRKELPKLLQRHGVASQMPLQNIVIQLRKACSHPYLFDGVEPEPFEEGDHLIKASGKLLILDSILQSLHAEKHRVLIYAQMTRTLDILQDYLEFQNYVYERLDGSVRAEERFVAARKFNAESIMSEGRQDFSETAMPFVFLLTTRAGGVGLNLTAADTVIFYEQDWNPQADKQALQRAHRIGQTNPVLAINLVTENTVEEVILSRAKKKLKLTNDVMGDSTLDSDDDGLDKAKPSDLQSLIIFGLDKLDSSSVHPQTEDEAMPQMAQVVQQALLQRVKEDGDASANENYMSNSELEENLYTFEGQDFTPKKRKDINGTDDDQPQDEAVLNSWIQKLDGVSANQELVNRRGRKRNIGESVDIEKDRAAKQQKMEIKMKAKWDAMGYTSMAVQDPGEVNVGMQTDNDEVKVHFVFGDCTKPSAKSDEPAVIFSVVDDSGVWGSGGMFSALDKLSPHVQEAYEAAHAAGDLHVSDLHLISIDDGADKKQGTEANEGQFRLWVGLGVVQSYNRRRKLARSDISLSALEACLRKIMGSAAAMNASMHMPRISSRPGQDRKEWYAIERLLRKHVSQTGVPLYVYYYRRPDRDD